MKLILTAWTFPQLATIECHPIQYLLLRAGKGGKGHAHRTQHEPASSPPGRIMLRPVRVIFLDYRYGQQYLSHTAPSNS